MDKRTFIQHAVLAWVPRIAAPDVTARTKRAIARAEQSWMALSAAGYGAKQPHQPRESENWYARLDERQQRGFDRFWNAFAHKHGRHGAAMRWSQLNPDDELTAWILHAAAQEAKQPIPHGQTRKMAQGWLNDRRWEDYPPPGGKPDRKDQDCRERQERAAELANARKMAERTGGELRDYWQQKVAELEGVGGAGTTGIAALEGSRPYTGVEIVPEYHTAAVERLRSATPPSNTNQ